jgi:hypothetical protein
VLYYLNIREVCNEYKKDLKTTKSNIGICRKVLILSILFFSNHYLQRSYSYTPSGTNSYSSAQAQNPATTQEDISTGFGAMAGAIPLFA